MSVAATNTKSPDPRVATAIAHWAPRFVSNGVLLADFEEVTAGIERWEDWCRAWCERGEVHEALGREALAQGYKLTAGEHLVRASMYYHFAKFVFVHDQKQMRDAHLRSLDCYQAALPLMCPAGERVAIPFEGKTLYGVLRRPAGSTGRSPILIMAPGLDSTKEELHPYAEPFLARGIAREQPLCRRGRRAEERRHTVDEGGCRENRLPDLHRDRAPGSSGAGFARRAAGEGRLRPGGVAHRRGRRAQCQQPPLSLSKPDGRLACRAAGLAQDLKAEQEKRP